MCCVLSIWKMNKELVDRYKKANILFNLWARVQRHIFDFRNGDLSYSELKKIIQKEINDV